MAISNEDLIRVLNDVIATCADSEEGFGKAAKGVHSDELRGIFTDISRQRGLFTTELDGEVKKRGGEPSRTGHFGGILHRGWVDLETRIRPKDDPSFLAECERGEESTLKHYDHALGLDLPPEVKAILERQAAEVRQTITRLRAMENVRKAG